MKISEIRQWAFQNGLEDSWIVADEHQAFSTPWTLDMLEDSAGQRLWVIHASQAGTSPTWIKVDWHMARAVRSGDDALNVFLGLAAVLCFFFGFFFLWLLLWPISLVLVCCVCARFFEMKCSSCGRRGLTKKMKRCPRCKRMLKH